MEFIHIVNNIIHTYTKQEAGLFPGLKRNIEYLGHKLSGIIFVLF